MKKNTITLLLALSPFLGYSQGVKANTFDKFLKKHRVETEAVPISGLTAGHRLSIAFKAIDTALFFSITGSGWGTRTVDKGDELRLLFSNDSVISLKSVALQGIEPGPLESSYHHQYSISAKQLPALSKYTLVAVRKFSFSTFTDLKIPSPNASKLNKLSAVFAGELKKANLFRSVAQISLKNVLNHIGDSVQFCSKVYRTRYFKNSAEGPTLLDVQADFSDPFVNVVILEKDRPTFNGMPENMYLNKEVCIRGVLSLRDNIPYLAVHNRSQITVKSPVDLSEIRSFVGDSITVNGTSFAANTSSGNAVPSLLYLGAPPPNQQLNLIIENTGQTTSIRPEALANKKLRLSGVVKQENGRLQMAVRKTEQVQVLGDAEPAPSLAVKKSDTAAKSVQTTAVAQPAKQPAPAVKKEIRQTKALFPGGDSAFVRFIRNNITVPAELRTHEEKTVTISFDVDTKGIWRNLRLENSAGKKLDSELIRVLKSMPKWIPATKDGMAIPSQVTYPVVIVEKLKAL